MWSAECCVCVPSVPPCSVQPRHPAELPAGLELGDGCEGPQQKCCHREHGLITGTLPRAAQNAPSKVGFSNPDQALWMKGEFDNSTEWIL